MSGFDTYDIESGSVGGVIAGFVVVAIGKVLLSVCIVAWGSGSASSRPRPLHWQLAETAQPRRVRN